MASTVAGSTPVVIHPTLAHSSAPESCVRVASLPLSLRSVRDSLCFVGCLRPWSLPGCRSRANAQSSTVHCTSTYSRTIQPLPQQTRSRVFEYYVFLTCSLFDAQLQPFAWSIDCASKIYTISSCLSLSLLSGLPVQNLAIPHLPHSGYIWLLLSSSTQATELANMVARLRYLRYLTMLPVGSGLLVHASHSLHRLCRHSHSLVASLLAPSLPTRPADPTMPSISNTMYSSISAISGAGLP